VIFSEKFTSCGKVTSYPHTVNPFLFLSFQFFARLMNKLAPLVGFLSPAGEGNSNCSGFCKRRIKNGHGAPSHSTISPFSLPVSAHALVEVGSLHFSLLRYFFPSFLHSPARCLTNFPSARHNVSTFAKSSAVKSPPASAADAPFRLTCITPTTFPSHKIGALTIF